MIISPINFAYNYNDKTTFKSTASTVYNKVSGKTYSRYTKFFREDLNWERFIKFINKKYANVPKVNIINYASSDGSEPWSLGMLIMEYIKNPERMLPIKAFDFDDKNIIESRQGICQINSGDIVRLNRLIPSWNYKYMKPFRTNDYGSNKGVKLYEHFQDKVTFTKKDITTDFEEKLPPNTIILCRNMWPYLESWQQKLLIYKLQNTLDETGLLVIGDLERNYGITSRLAEAGFVETDVDGVFYNPKPLNQRSDQFAAQ